MFNYREFGIHFMTFVYVFCTSLFVIPNLTTNLKKYNKGMGILINSRIYEREYIGKYFQKKNEKTLVLNLDNGMELKLSGKYSKFWDEFQDKESIGKTITYYLGNNITYGSNPIQIELDNKIIYTPNENRIWAYLSIIMTIGFMIYSGKKIYNFFVKSN